MYAKGLAEREIYISTQIFFFSTRLTPPLPLPSIYGNFGHVCMFFREEFVCSWALVIAWTEYLGRV